MIRVISFTFIAVCLIMSVGFYGIAGADDTIKEQIADDTIAGADETIKEQVADDTIAADETIKEQAEEMINVSRTEEIDEAEAAEEGEEILDDAELKEEAEEIIEEHAEEASK